MRKTLANIKLIVLDLKRQIEVLMKLRSHKLVGYTKKHPIFTDLFEKNPPQGYVFYIRSKHPILNLIDTFIWKKIQLLHLDAASPFDASLKIPIVVECEGHPRKEFFTNPQIKNVYVESKWAAGNYLNTHNIDLLYPSVSIPPLNFFTKKGHSEFTYLTAVGYGGMVKGFDVVYNIYKTLKKEFKVKLILAGTFGHNYQWYPEITKEAYERANFHLIETEIKTDPDIEFGPVKRNKLHSEVYPQTDIYIHLSRLETFGYSILEAMSYGIPVVATNLHAIPEMVEDGHTGFLINDFSDDINSIEWYNKSYLEGLHAVRTLIVDKDRRLTMGRNAYQRVQEKFNIENKRKKVEALYNSILQ